MQFTLLPISLLISFAAAQSSTAASSGTTSVCAAQPVLEACLASTQAIAAGCASTDYKCLCEKNNDVLTCFQQCPNDPRYGSVLSTKQTYCADSSVYTSAFASSTISVNPSSTGSGAEATTTGGSSDSGSDSQPTATGDAGAVQTGSETTSAATTSSTNNGASGNVMVGAGGVMVGLAGLVGALL